ncbi:MAG: amidohydrolase [Candidatus Aminicenantes bacterium]|jgi:amidohydrolase
MKAYKLRRSCQNHRIYVFVFLLAVFFFFSGTESSLSGTDESVFWEKIEKLCKSVENKVISWRRDIHEHPELGNREYRTAKLVADHLRQLGLDVKTEVAYTGVVGLLRGKQAEPVVALRADMDALPVKELTDLPFASKVTTIYNGKEVPVMHACGHDAHTAILMGVAEVLAGVKDQIPGTVKFIFQPSEDSRPSGENGGAGLMIKEGVLENPNPGAILGLHVGPMEHGSIGYRSGSMMAGVNSFRIVVRGSQTHGAVPWAGVDPVVASSQIILGLQTIVSRQVDLTEAPAIVTVGSIHGGVQGNIIPDEVVLTGTIRSYGDETRADILKRVRSTAETIAESAGAKAEVWISDGLPSVVNDPGLTEMMAPVLERVAGKDKVVVIPRITGGEDFAYYQQHVPGLFFFLGINPVGADPAKAAPNHSPYFYIEESALIVGVRALAHLAVFYLEGK